MPRFFVFAGKTGRLACAIVAGICLAVAVRADQPSNPLRSGSPTPAMRVMPVPSDASVKLRTLADDDAAPLDLPSVVPAEMGQPELLPAPSDRERLLNEYDEPDFHAGVPWENQVHPLFAHPWFPHSDPNDPHRHIGIGQPLIGTSWRNRPIYFGSFVGGIMMDDLVPNQIYQNDTAFVGLRLGWDFDHFWGLEMRGAFARPDLADLTGGTKLPASRDNFADMDLLFYPLGDTRWRPYLLAGLGFQTFRFNDQLGHRISEAPLMIPLGCGMKYFVNPWFTMRFDFVDNMCMGNQRISGMHNLAFMYGVEFRFGGRKPSYFPWHNNAQYW